MGEVGVVWEPRAAGSLGVNPSMHSPYLATALCEHESGLCHDKASQMQGKDTSEQEQAQAALSDRCARARNAKLGVRPHRSHTTTNPNNSCQTAQPFPSTPPAREQAASYTKNTQERQTASRLHRRTHARSKSAASSHAGSCYAPSGLHDSLSLTPARSRVGPMRRCRFAPLFFEPFSRGGCPLLRDRPPLRRPQGNQRRRNARDTVHCP
jgi:hypothetical protein